MPFSRTECCVSGCLEPFGNHDVFFWDNASLALKVEERSSRQKHGSAGNTDSPACSSHDVGSGESHTPSAQAVQIGSHNLRISQSIDRIEPLIIRKKEENIGTTSLTQGTELYSSQGHGCSAHAQSLKEFPPFTQ